MILTRLDATVQSFSWSDKVKSREGEIAGLYRDTRARMLENPGVGLHDLLAAR